MIPMNTRLLIPLHVFLLALRLPWQSVLDHVVEHDGWSHEGRVQVPAGPRHCNFLVVVTELGLVDATTTPNMEAAHAPQSHVPWNTMLIQSFFVGGVGDIVLVHSESLLKDWQFKMLKQISTRVCHGFEFDIFVTFEVQRLRPPSATRTHQNTTVVAAAKLRKLDFVTHAPSREVGDLGEFCQLTHGGMPALGSVVLLSPASLSGMMPAAVCPGAGSPALEFPALMAPGTASQTFIGSPSSSCSYLNFT